MDFNHKNSNPKSEQNRSTPKKMQNSEEIGNDTADMAESSQTTDLPHYIIMQEILPRLPVESLIHFKSVSKSWYTTISSYTFAKLCLKSSPSCDKFLMIDRTLDKFIRTDPPFYLLPYNKAYGKINDLIKIVLSDFNFVDYMSYFYATDELCLVGSCDGLVCFDCLREGSSHFWVWNPATHELRKIGNPGCVGFSNAHFFGYASSDYHIISSFWGQKEKWSGFYMFSLGEGLWKRIGGLDEGIGERFLDCSVWVRDTVYCSPIRAFASFIHESEVGALDKSIAHILDTSVWVDGTVFWVYLAPPEYANQIIGLNIQKEELKEYPMSIWEGFQYDDMVLHRLKGCLAMHAVTRYTLDFWLLKKADVWSSWEKLFTADWDMGVNYYDFHGSVSFLYLSEDGKCLLRCYDQFRLVDLCKEEIERAQGDFVWNENEDIDLYKGMARVAMYTRSLVSPFRATTSMQLMKIHELFSKTTQALFYNYKQDPIQRMLDFDFLCGRETPSVAGIISPGSQGFQKLFFGQGEIAIPVHSTIEAACAAHPTADVFINFASFKSAAASSMAALEQPTIRVAAIIAEDVPESDTEQLIAFARENNKVVIGPATVGCIQAGAFQIGDTAGTIDNIIQCKLYRPGSVGFVSKSGGMSNELYNTIARVTDGIYEGIAFGGDVFPGSTLSDHVLRFNNIPQVKMMVVLGESGGRDEYSLVEALKRGKINKPVVAWISETRTRLFKSEVQYGHAGAKSGGDMESAQGKNQALREVGALVPVSYEAFESAIKQTFDQLVEEGKTSPVKEFTPPQIPEDLNSEIKRGKVRAPTHIISTISDDRGEEPCYAGVPMSSIIEQGLGVGDIISLLWFKRGLPRYCTQFIEICIMLCADHGPCVSGAHNTIVTARAGKDLVSSLVSGLLTIGPRFGGAIDDAARYFKDAYDRNLTAYEFVESMKKKGIRVPGIGHRIKRGDNRDTRVELLQEFARTHFPSVKYMEYAVQVETYILSKANNLVLNVDGAIGSLFLDLLSGSGMFAKPEIDEIVEIGYLNGLFVLARSIGLIGHTFDQKRLKQPLYRHPWEDVLYAK